MTTKLQEYLDREGISYAEFARRAGTRHARTIERIAKGQQMPGNQMFRGILAASNNEVTPNDFHDIPPNTRRKRSRKTLPTETA